MANLWRFTSLKDFPLALMEMVHCIPTTIIYTSQVIWGRSFCVNIFKEKMMKKKKTFKWFYSSHKIHKDLKLFFPTFILVFFFFSFSFCFVLACGPVYLTKIACNTALPKWILIKSHVLTGEKNKENKKNETKTYSSLPIMLILINCSDKWNYIRSEN